MRNKISENKYIKLTMIVIGILLFFLIGENLPFIYRDYQNEQQEKQLKIEVEKKEKRSETIDKKIEKLGYKKDWSNRLNYTIKKETDTKKFKLEIHLDNFIYDDILETSGSVITYGWENGKNIEYGIRDNGQESYWLYEGDSYCYKLIPEDENDEDKDVWCNKSEMKEVKKAKKAYNQFKKDLDVTDEELATWGAWKISEEYKNEQK